MPRYFDQTTSKLCGIKTPISKSKLFVIVSRMLDGKGIVDSLRRNLTLLVKGIKHTCFSAELRELSWGCSDFDRAGNMDVSAVSRVMALLARP